MSKRAATILMALGLAQLGCRDAVRPPELFSPHCAEQERGWTTDELAEIAFKAATGRTNREGARIRIWQDGCGIVIGVDQKEHHVGSHFGVTVSAIDGRVLDITSGE